MSPAAARSVVFVEDRPWATFVQLAAALRRAGVPTARVIVDGGPRHRGLAVDRPVWSRTIDLRHASRADLLDPAAVAGVHAVESPAAADAMARLGLPAPIDKIDCAARLRSAGVDAPEQLDGPTTPADAACARFGLPVVAKQALGAGGGGVVVARTAAEAASAARTFGDSRWVWERFVEGDALAVGAMAVGSTLPLVAPYRRIGSGLDPAEVVEPVDAPDLVALASRVVAALGVEGLVCFDVIRDRDGRAWVHDVNHRAWSCFAAFRTVGVDFAGAYCDWVLGRPVTPAVPLHMGRALPVMPAALHPRSDPMGAARMVGTYLRWFGARYLVAELASRPRRR